MNPTLSIIMACKNSANFISKTLESVLAQTFQNWELIIVNDNSADNTAEIIKNFKDSRFKYFKVEGGTGIPYARNYAIDKSNSQIMVIADSDDIMKHNRLEVINKYFKTYPDTNMFYSNIDLVYLDSNTKITRPFQPFDKNILKNVNFIPDPASAFKKDSYINVGGYDMDLKMSLDYDLWLKFLEKGFRFGFINEPLVEVSRYAKSTTGSKKDELRGFIHLVKSRHNLPQIADINYLKNNTKDDVFKYFTTPGGMYLWFE